MHDTNFSLGNIVIKSVDGTEQTIENVKMMPLIEEVEDLDNLNEFKNSLNEGITLSLETANISRKRFIKLLMARGIARNGAKDIADYVFKKYGFYNELMLLTM